MTTALLNLISSPVAVLNTLGLDLAVGLSSEDPVGGRRGSEPYDAYLTVYTPDGAWLDRVCLGEIPPNRRRLIDVSTLTHKYVPYADHLTVVHRVPRRLLAGGARPEDVVELERADRDYSMFRTVVQYAVPGGSHGAVIYETPPGLNAGRPGSTPSGTLTFTSKVVLSQVVDTYIVLIHYSVDSGYGATVPYRFAFFAPHGELLASGERRLSPFTLQVIDARQTISTEVVERYRDRDDGLACFSYVGGTRDAALVALVLTLSRSSGAVAVEHTHPAQAYTLPSRPEDKSKVKRDALASWESLLGGREVTLG